ncbi:MAG: aminotransferase class III-fold pyridoxal phosphate-dependent enzyme [Pirellula sp.]|jgi:acetylornithine aminotransferase|nr:aminotransferase class III-fold pyridoxal phosphate-dependent enzyme [Pirellula sp.]
MLHSQELHADPRVAQAKELLLAALHEHSQSITEVRGPRPELQASYTQMLARLAVARGGAPYFPYITSGLGNGPFVELADGSVKLDFIVGIGVHGLGHSHPAMLTSTVDASLDDTVMQGNLQQNSPSLEMCERLIKLANATGANLQHCLLTTSGAMANENSLKIAFHNRAPATRVICLDNCFAGRSIALAQLTDRPAYRTGLPKALDVDYIPMFHPSDPEGTTKGAISALKKHLARRPGEYACLWLELVAGEGGYYPGTKDYFESLCQICHEHNVLVIFDEVQTFSRLSQPFAFQHFGLEKYADILTLGKITQVCATLYGEKLKPKGPLLSQTFTAASASIRSGLAVLDQLEAKNCFGPNGWNMQRHAYFRSKLEALARKYPTKISGPWGEGMMIALTPGDGSAKTGTETLQRLYDLGLMGFLAGANPNRIRFLPPPGITTEAHIDIACAIIEQAIASAA